MEETMNANDLHERHFEFLRFAKMRGLDAEYIGGGLYKVPSFSRKCDGIKWVVNLPARVSTCPARSYCTHLASAVDYYFVNEDTPTDYTLYGIALADDRLALRLRVRSGETTRADRIYLRFCVRFYQTRRKAAGLSVISERQVHVGGGRYRNEQRCGAFTL